MIKNQSLVQVKAISKKLAEQIRVLTYNGDLGIYLRDYVRPQIEKNKLVPVGWIDGKYLKGNLFGQYWLIETPKGLFFVPSWDKTKQVEQLFIN